MSQLIDIQRHLAKGSSLTPLGALKRFGCERLAARIHTLKKQRFPVESEFVDVGNGKRVKRYWFDRRLVRK